MKRHPTLLSALLLALVLTACGGGSGDEGNLADSPGEADAGASEGELVVGMTEDQYAVEGPDASVSLYPHYAQVMETLTVLTPEYEVQPLLAQRWELREPNTWRFFLRQGVNFQDGQPLTATAVKEGLFDRIAAQGGGGIGAGEDSVVVIDDYTLDFTPTAQNLQVPQELTHPTYAVAAPGSDIGQRPVGTGPFTFQEYVPDERLVVERNDDYWGEEKAKLSRLTFRFYPDASSRRLALEAGELDVAFDLPRSDISGLESKDFQVERSAVGSYLAMYANLNGEAPFDQLKDVNVRKAIAYSIDRETLVEAVLEGIGTTDQTWVPPGTLGPYASMVQGFEHDPDKARRLLEQSGWTLGQDSVYTKDGRPLSLSLVSGFPSAEALTPIPEFLQSELKKVGIALEIVQVPDRAGFNELIKPGQGDLFLELGNQNNGNPVFSPSFVDQGPAARGGRTLSFTGAAFQDKMASAYAESDVDRVRELVAEALTILVDQEAGVIPLAGIYRVYVMRPEVQDFMAHPSFTNVRWDDVYLSE